MYKGSISFHFSLTPAGEIENCTRLSDGRTDRQTVIIARPRLHSMQRGNNVHFISV